MKEALIESSVNENHTMNPAVVCLATRNTPLPSSSLLNVKSEKTDKAITHISSYFVYIVALISVGVGILTAVLMSPILVDISCVFLTCFGPYMAYQKRKLIHLGGFRNQVNVLRDKVNHIMETNQKLTSNINNLCTSVDKLEEVQANLATLTDTNNVSRLVQVVKDTMYFNKQIRENIEARILQDIITTVMRSDHNMDLRIDPRELKLLMMRLDHMPGFVFNEVRFKEILNIPDDTPISITKIIEVTRNLLDDNENNVFVFDQQITE